MLEWPGMSEPAARRRRAAWRVEWYRYGVTSKVGSSGSPGRRREPDLTRQCLKSVGPCNINGTNGLACWKIVTPRLESTNDSLAPTGS